MVPMSEPLMHRRRRIVAQQRDRAPHTLAQQGTRKKVMPPPQLVIMQMPSVPRRKVIRNAARLILRSVVVSLPSSATETIIGIPRRLMSNSEPVMQTRRPIVAHQRRLVQYMKRLWKHKQVEHQSLRQWRNYFCAC